MYCNQHFNRTFTAVHLLAAGMTNGFITIIVWQGIAKNKKTYPDRLYVILNIFINGFPEVIGFPEQQLKTISFDLQNITSF